MVITDEVRLEHYKAFDKQKAIYERVLFKLFYSALNKEAFNVLNGGFFNESTLFDAYLSSFEIIFKRYAKKADMMQLKSDLPQDIGIGFFSRIFREKVRSYLVTTAGTRIKNVNDNTIAQIRKVIGENQASGARKTGAQIKKQITGINKNRALLIARTESLTAMNYISHEASIQQGVTSKAWLHSIGKSKDYREAHLAISEKVIPINEKFYVNGVFMDYPGDPAGGAENNCNCRCSVLYGYQFAEKPNYENLFSRFAAGIVAGVFGLMR
jgi:hypothetical protein